MGREGGVERLATDTQLNPLPIFLPRWALWQEINWEDTTKHRLVRILPNLIYAGTASPTGSDFRINPSGTLPAPKYLA